MEKLKEKSKLIIAIIAVVIIAGIVVVMTMGFNFELQYQQSQNIELYLNKEFKLEEIKEIAMEVLQSDVVVQEVELYGDTAYITAKEISEEQRNQIVQKVNQKYETELKAEEITIENNPHIKGYDIIKLYIIPFILVTVIILIYVGIKYRKIGVYKVMLITAISLIVMTALLGSIIAIARIPVVRFTVPMELLVYLLTLVGVTTIMENKLEEIKEKED